MKSLSQANAPRLDDRQNRYDRIFETERLYAYPIIDALEDRNGYRVDRNRLERAARILACPLKEHAPNWQHGRLLYSVVREYLEGYRANALLLDIGTAKGFSALVLQWALEDSRAQGQVVSVDVIDPRSRESRNSVAEVTGPKTLAEILAPWPETRAIKFLQSTGIEWLKKYTGRIHVAFVDGKHSPTVVQQEAALLADRQQAGDITVFDDLHLVGLRAAVKSTLEYDTELIQILPNRAYGIARRR